MSALTQGTHVYLLYPDGGTSEVIQIRKVVSHNPGTAPATQIDETTLEDLTYMNYRAGLRDPGQASITVRASPTEPSHIALHELSEASPSPTVQIAVGWSDGTEAPTVATAGGGFELPNTRTWFTYSAYVADFPFDFQQNTTVETQATLQRTGGGVWQPKGAA